MNLQDCWTSYLKAEQLLEQGHWFAAQHVFEQVLQYMPEHIQLALQDEDTKPCQFACLLSGLRNASVAQSEILNRMGEHNKAFDLLNQTYALLQFISLEASSLVRRNSRDLHKHSDAMLNHMTAFCTAHAGDQWTQELKQVQQSHLYFRDLKYKGGLMPVSPLLN